MVLGRPRFPEARLPGLSPGVLTDAPNSTPAARSDAAHRGFEPVGRLITPPAAGSNGGQASCQAAGVIECGVPQCVIAWCGDGQAGEHAPRQPCGLSL